MARLTTAAVRRSCAMKRSRFPVALILHSAGSVIDDEYLSADDEECRALVEHCRNGGLLGVADLYPGHDTQNGGGVLRGDY